MAHDDLDFRLGAHGGDHNELDAPSPLDNTGRMEPLGAGVPSDYDSLASIAISLKRIADTLAVAQMPVDDWQDVGVVYADEQGHSAHRYYGRLVINRRTGEHRVEKMHNHRINRTIGVEHGAIPAPASCLEALGVQKGYG